MMRKLIAAVERLRKRFDFANHKKEEAQALSRSAAKRPPKRKRRR